MEWKQETTTTYMSLRRDFALSLILGLQNGQFCVISSVASTRGLREYPLPSRYQHLLRKLLKRPFKIQGPEEPSLL